MPTLAPEIIFHIGNFPITNTILNTILVDIILIAIVLFISKKITKLVPGMFQNIIELLVQGFYNLTEAVAGKNTNKIFPFFMSLFLFIIVANWSGLILGSELIGLKEHDSANHHLIPIFRSASSDMNFTISLALISVFATHILSLKTIGIKKYLSHYLSFNPINLFVGLLDVVSEITKVISLSFRLFGNILAGEIMLVMIGGLLSFFVIPVPFIAFEIFVGLIQAIVFSILTMVFMAMLMTPKHDEH